MEDNLILIPEFIIHTTLTNVVKFIREDYALQTDKEKSYLCKLLNSLGFERYSYKKQAIEVFLASNEEPRYLTVDLMFNMKKDAMPSLHICMPSESPGQNALGMDSSDNYINTQGDEIESTQAIFKRRYKATYDIVIVSDNSNEVVMLYHVFKALLVALSPHLTLSGVENTTFSGQDLQPYAELVPKNIFMRAIRLGIEYESSTLSFENHKLISEIVFENKVVNGE